MIDQTNLAEFRFILASTSPRRRELLALLGLPFVTVSPGFASQEVDETPRPGEAPAELVQRLSRDKAEAVANNIVLLLPFDSAEEVQTVIIAADTEVVLDEQILGKPGTPAEAAQMLKQLRRQPHEVYSGLTVAWLPQPSVPPSFQTRLHRSRVWMRAYTDAEIADYIATGSPLDKAGAYGIQDQPFAPVERLEGCFASVMGLPLGELARALEQIGVSLPPIGPACARFTGQLCCQEPGS